MNILLALLWLLSVVPPTPTPEPSPTPDMLLMPAGDVESATFHHDDEKLDTPSQTSSHDVTGLHHVTPRTLHIRVCVDADQNMRCDFREGLRGVPVYLTDTATGAVLAQGVTDDSGLYSALLDTQASLSVHAPYLGVSELMQQDAVQLRIAYGMRPPKELP